MGVGAVALGCARPARAPSDYQRDLAALEREIDEAARDGAADREPRAAIQRAVLLQRRWALTGDSNDLMEAARLLGVARGALGSSPALLLLSAMVALDSHRLDDARQLLAGIVDAAGGADAEQAPVDVGADEDHEWPMVSLIRGDLALQEGQLDQAGAAYRRALGPGRRWDALARLAHLRYQQGESEEADRLYVESEDQLDAKQMRTFAWLEVARGRIAFAHGRFADARTRYRRAARAYSGYWLVEARLAEVAAAEGQVPEALAAYEDLCARTANPELAQTLGELYVFSGQPARARPFFDRALAAYQASVDRGEVHYLHHLAAFHADVSGDAAQAVRWAERDRALRPGTPSAQDQLAWALFRAGRMADASRASAAALVVGASEAHVLFHAALIDMAVGRRDEGERLLQRIAAINPGYETTFHAHQ